MLIPLTWLGESVALGGRDAHAVAAALVGVGLEEEAVHSFGVDGPLVVGEVLSVDLEPQKNGKTIRWCRVDVGAEYNNPGPRGIVCGAHNFVVGDRVAVALPGAVLPGPFPISARQTYGHLSDGMICSERELGLGEDHSGIMVLSRYGLDAAVGTDAIGLLGLGEQTVEINVTPDRGYCFSIRGVAREFSHATGQPFRDPADLPVPPSTSGGFPVAVDDAAPIHGQIGCDRFVARIVRGCHAFQQSPQWMRRRLVQAGMRPISLGVDVTNYVMLEIGQPLHAYDLAGVAGPIVVRRARSGERLMTLDDTDRALDPEDLLITDSPGGSRGSRVIGIAGVMGGASCEVSETTTDLLIEAAHFDPVSVSRTSRRHKLSSEAARRFERGVDPKVPPYAVQRAIDLLIEYGGGQADPEVTDLDSIAPAPVIAFDPTLASRLVGVDYGSGDVERVLKAIGCAVDARVGSSWQVVPPSWRPDLSRPVDLVEEVARIDGYQHIPSLLPTAPAGTGLTHSQRLRRSGARALAEFGLVEVLSYPFVAPDIFDRLGLGAADPRRRATRLTNPLDQNAPLLRTEIVQTLIDPVRRNVARGLTDFGVFELGQVTIAREGAPLSAGLPKGAARPTDAELAQLHAAVPNQPRHAAAILVGARQPAGVHGPARAADWADAVEAARTLARVVHVILDARPTRRAPWHPGRCAELAVGDAIVGYAGELHPSVLTALDLPARAVAFELDLDALLAVEEGTVAALPISTHPVAKEDLAFVVDDAVPSAAVVAAVRRGAGDAVERAEVFDVYTGDQVGEGAKSVAVALRLRAPDHTLSAAEVASARQAAIGAVQAELGGVLRA
ncbi:MAG: phenylalanine--tRNA ligase subunit beta [Bifidobacteriaceae bacterium]|jgi:phenylalanyl-tRNA synthetase beta chain|nr:phenylalanine--tRNA ligase subunit beta [Bifidobacteriaceae bacterium]